MPDDSSYVNPLDSAAKNSYIVGGTSSDAAVPSAPTSGSSSVPEPTSTPSVPDPVPTTSPTPPAPEPPVQEPPVEPPVPEPSAPEPPVPEPPVQTPPVQTPPAVPEPPVVQDFPVREEVPAPQRTGLSPEDYKILADVANKISDAQNILVALSSDPSVDEMAAAIGLTLYLDRLGKHTTAIYSGTTPNALEFLKPEETFDSSADTLQDFVIALDKEKADHLRYKLDGDYVKIYITPYRTHISQDDLEFSYGDFNVDLVLALDVMNGIDLDAALREHGRIMHDAVVVNITTGNPGKFGEIEWSDKRASSVSEMIAKLLYNVTSDVEVSKEEATAFLTGIIAATNRFSNANTTPDTMQIASRLMGSGANQQLIAKNITPEVDNEMLSLLSGPAPSKEKHDPTKLDIQHEGDEVVDSGHEVDGDIADKTSTLLDDLKAAEASLSQTGSETTPDDSNQPVLLEDKSTPTPESTISELNALTPEELSELNAQSVPEATQTPAETPTESTASTPSTPATPSEPSAPAATASTEPSLPEVPSAPDSQEAPKAPKVVPVPEGIAEEISSAQDAGSETTVQPLSEFNTLSVDEESAKYGKMLEEALAKAEANPPAPPSPESVFQSNPAEMNAPAVNSAPEINGVPEINYAPASTESILPPPPAPPISASIMPDPLHAPAADAGAPASPSAALPTVPIEPAGGEVPPTPTYLGKQPSMQDQVYRPQAADPAAFKIPGA